ncbi:hypothetical protein [Bacillus alkalicellulosilyticus]|uniref:hypothetical protein n=1 Tax=Alkalihalobacterium alkalicellulosilyticum TaxID=1912214 RepID=UPI0009962058|nr:hypothetical protein [Bacillus alkalicellulosilyticus]
MEHVFLITGDVEHTLTIDPSVWIFDEQKIDLTTYFDSPKESDNELEKYTKAISAQWDQEILEGSKPPALTNDNKLSYNKQELLSGSYAMKLGRFLTNAKPKEKADSVTIETAECSEYTFSLEEASSFLLQFSKEGKPLRESGPVHILFEDGSNRSKPIQAVTRIIVGSL